LAGVVVSGDRSVPWKPPIHRPIGRRDKAERDRDYARRRNRDAAALYRSAAWRQARAEFLAMHPACSTCGARASVVDHRDPHRGDPAIFWDRSRWQPQCACCHNRKTAARDGGFGNRRR
jgi:5-methylcytosine-specific restriction protein A